jgi:putative acetyltransferase
MKLSIRPEGKEDYSVIREINRKAFDTDAEANLIDALRKSNVPIISLVAEYNDMVVGHILFREGIKFCRDAGYSAVVVLGHPQFYPHFGFKPSAIFKITSEFDVPADVFMAKELQKGAMLNCSGTVRYHDAFEQF